MPFTGQTVSIAILDVYGKEITKLTINNNEPKIPLSLNNVARGFYFIKIRSGGMVFRERITLW